MLARWFDRNGIGQILAPDEKAAAQGPEVDEAHSTLWQFLAPDPNFAPPTPPPPGAFAMRNPPQVLCLHCHQWTEVTQTRISSNPTTPQASDANDAITPGTPFRTPVPASSAGSSSSKVEDLVLSAAKETSKAFCSPPHWSKSADKVFRACVSTKMEDKMAKRLVNLLTKDPSLVRARATHLGQLVPDSFTPLLAAAYAGQTKAAEILFQVAPPPVHATLLDDRDLQGRTALHIAAEQGHLEMVHFLLPKYTLSVEEPPAGKLAISSPPPVDLLGKTPLGRAITSPNPTAKKRRKALESSLFSPGDISIMGDTKPAAERTAHDETLQLAYGVADMPGMRVTMEDAVCISRLEVAGKAYWLFGVCDGHGDSGKVSSFVAANLPSILISHQQKLGEDWQEIWKKTFLQVDDQIQQEGLMGGSTAVFALIGRDIIVTVNLGDSRAILIQSSSPSTTSSGELEVPMENLDLTTDPAAEGYPATIDQDHPQKVLPDRSEEATTTNRSWTLPLSEDHKPDLPEEQARIHKAGMKVVPVTFEEDGEEVTIYKVCKSETDMLAVSRAFGDFDYKMNTLLGPEDQAIMAVPDVHVQARNPEQDSYLVLACDGIWDVCDNDMVKDFILRQVQDRKDTTDTVLPDVGDALLVEALNRGSRDNMTTILIALGQALPRIRTGIQGKTLDFTSPTKYSI